ncbi:MAG: nickel pincer cofactor biosynthesis protein LarB [Gemmatimonadota bacterium]
MRRDRLRQWLEDLSSGRRSLDETLRVLEREPFVEDVGFARLDHHRRVRHGDPEAVYCPGKSVEQIVHICRRLAERGDGFLATRADDQARARLAHAFPSAAVHAAARVVHLAPTEPHAVPVRGLVCVVTAGTADLPVAEEVAVCAEAMGNPVTRVNDVGVAGLHRLLGAHEALREAAVLVVVAGMEAALASVIAGLLAAPVVAVPTSVGYGASFGGLAALLALLNSCAPGVVVVNIDNGYGAAAAATRINRLWQDGE